MSKNITVQNGNLVVELAAGETVTAANPSTLQPPLNARIHMSLGGVISESTGGVGGFEADTWAAGDKAYLGVYNDETGQYAELVAHGSTFGAGSLNHVLYSSTSVAPLDFLGDYKTIMQLESTSAANTFVNVTDGTILRIWDDTEVDNVAIQHDGTNLVFTPTTTDALALEGLYLNMLEIADPVFSADIGRGKLWVQNTTPNQLMFTDDAGNDIVAASLANTVNISGTPVDNQIAVWTNANTLEGDANFTWDASHFVIGVAPAADAITPTLAFGDGDTGFYEDIDDSISIAIATTQRFSFNASAIQSSSTGGSYVLQGPGSATIPNFTFVNDINTGVGKNADDQLSLISGGVEMLRLVETGTATTDQIIIAPAGIIGTNTTPALAFGDGDTGFYESSDDILYVTVGGANNFRFQTNTFIGSSSGAAYVQASAGAVGAPTYAINADTDTGMYSPAADAIALTAGGVEGIRFTEASSSVIQTHEANTGLTADVGSAQGNGVITSTYNVYSTVGTAGDAATLPATFPVGTTIYVKNDGANSMDVFPASGDDAGAGLNTAVAVDAGTSKTFIATVADSTWTTLIDGGGSSSVFASGTPLDNQVAVFTNANTIEGDANFTWTGTTLAIAGAGAQLLLPLENDDATPTLGFGDGDTGFYEAADGDLRLSIEAAHRYTWDANGFNISIATGPRMRYITPSNTIPSINPDRSDGDTGLGPGPAADQLSLIAGAKEMLRLVETGTATTDQVIITPAVTSPAGAATPTLAFGDGDTGFYENADDELSIAVTGARQWYYSGVSFRGNAGDSPALENNSPTSTDPNIIPNRSDLNTGIGWAAADQLSLVTGGVESKRLTAATLQTANDTQQEIISISVPSGTTFGYRINIVGNEAATGDTVFESIFGAIHNQAGTTAIVGSDIVDRTEDAGAAAWVVTVAADDTTDALTVDVTGEASHTIDWKVSVEILDV